MDQFYIDAYCRLANAIVVLACDDYRSYRKQLCNAAERLENVLYKMSTTGKKEIKKMKKLKMEKRDVEINIRLLNFKIL